MSFGNLNMNTNNNFGNKSNANNEKKNKIIKNKT